MRKGERERERDRDTERERDRERERVRERQRGGNTIVLTRSLSTLMVLKVTEISQNNELFCYIDSNN
jgi:hypothetical protein